MKLIYGIKDKPKFGQIIVFAIQQLLAIMAATLVVPVIINGNVGLTDEYAMSSAAALLGAGIGTLVYQLFTRFKSPVFLGSSFAFIGPMCAAFAGATSIQAGYLGLIIGAAMAGLVYVLIAVIVKFAGVKWIAKLMPAVVIGPTVAIIGLSLAGNAVGDLQKAPAGGSVYVAIICGLVTLAVTMLCATFGKKMIRLIPFIIGILAGYAVATIFTVIGNVASIDALKVINFDPLVNLFTNFGIESIVSVPDFTFMQAIKGVKEISGEYLFTVFVAYVPVAAVVFAEHLADHKNLSSIIEKDLLEDPGLHNTLLGDGVGSFAGALFGGCPNTTYGESVGCVAITGNASVITITVTAILAIAISFLSPFVAFVNTIPSCVMGGVCMALYGFIAVSGLKMIQKVDLEKNRNLFVVSVILIAGIGGLSVSFGEVTLTTVACALILGILANLMLGIKDGIEENSAPIETKNKKQ
ncbi:MAG: uracil-xanthine permease [Clostridia bacterium]|nr:uracil-xanthine permease [Clostridia bacterium]